MGQKETTTSFTVKKNEAADAARAGMSESIMDLALDCHDYYGDNDLAADVLRSKWSAMAATSRSPVIP